MSVNKRAGVLSLGGQRNWVFAFCDWLRRYMELPNSKAVPLEVAFHEKRKNIEL